jgi:hypothetical protein
MLVRIITYDPHIMNFMLMMDPNIYTFRMLLSAVTSVRDTEKHSAPVLSLSLLEVGKRLAMASVTRDNASQAVLGESMEEVHIRGMVEGTRAIPPATNFEIVQLG